MWCACVCACGQFFGCATCNRNFAHFWKYTECNLVVDLSGVRVQILAKTHICGCACDQILANLHTCVQCVCDQKLRCASVGACGSKNCGNSQFCQILMWFRGPVLVHKPSFLIRMTKFNSKQHLYCAGRVYCNFFVWPTVPNSYSSKISGKCTRTDQNAIWRYFA